MAISDWPVAEQPREKLLEKGPEALSDAELLAIFFRTGRPGVSAVELARELILKTGGLRQLLDADFATLNQTPGLGSGKFVQLRAGLELGKRYLESRLRRGDVLSNPSATRDYLNLCLRAYPHEVFACLFLDNRHQVICFEELFSGTIDGASVYPREVVKRALLHNAAALILAHNHPSGVAEPSQADRNITRRLSEALSLADIRVLDHIVVGDGQLVSFAERSLI